MSNKASLEINGKSFDLPFIQGTEQEQVANRVTDAGGTVDTWDGEYSNQWNGEKSPVNKDLAKNLTLEAFSKFYVQDKDIFQKNSKDSQNRSKLEKYCAK